MIIILLIMQDMICGGIGLPRYLRNGRIAPFPKKTSYTDDGSLFLPNTILEEPQASDVKLATEKALFDLLHSASSDLIMENMLEAVIRPG